MKMKITWLTQGSFLIEGDKRILIDPYMSDFLETHGLKRMVEFPLSFEELKPDFLICTHDHLDHLDPETVEKIAVMYPECIMVGPVSCCEHFKNLGIAEERIILFKKEISCQFGDIKIVPVPAFHSDLDAVGLVLEADKKIYITSDSVYDEKLINDYTANCDVLITCINGKMGNMNIDDALKLAEKIKPSIAFPMHYGLFAENTADPKLFIDGCKTLGINSKSLQVGISCHLADLADN